MKHDCRLVWGLWRFRLLPQTIHMVDQWDGAMVWGRSEVGLVLPQELPISDLSFIRVFNIAAFAAVFTALAGLVALATVE